MDTPTVPRPTQALSERFAALIAPKRTAKHVIDDSDYLAMMWRMVRALEARTINNPELLTQCVALVERLAEVVNVAIYVNATRYGIDPRAGASMKECARAMGISAPSASERKARGERVVNARIEAAGATRFSEARREREAIEAAEAFAVVELAEYRARHRAA